jgi:hypothetical protein
VAVWRRRALEAFPELRRQLNDKREIFSIYALWSEVLPLAEEAHENWDMDLLDRIYAFALWCSRQRSEDLWNSAGVAFYEHLLPDLPGECVGDMLARLPDGVVADVWGLWERITPEERMEHARSMLRQQKRPIPRSPSDAVGPSSGQAKRERRTTAVRSQHRRRRG